MHVPPLAQGPPACAPTASGKLAAAGLAPRAAQRWAQHSERARPWRGQTHEFTLMHTSQRWPLTHAPLLPFRFCMHSTIHRALWLPPQARAASSCTTSGKPRRLQRTQQVARSTTQLAITSPSCHYKPACRVLAALVTSLPFPVPCGACLPCASIACPRDVMLVVHEAPAELRQFKGQAWPVTTGGAAIGSKCAVGYLRSGLNNPPEKT